MSTKSKTVVSITLWAVLSIRPGAGQVAPATIIEIDVENRVRYLRDVIDHSSLATDPNIKGAVFARNFAIGVTIADIVAVNGKPARGVHVDRVSFINLRTSPTPGLGQAIADIAFPGTISDITWEILQPDGTPVGTIMAMGFGGGPQPPGAPLTVTGSNLTIVGGTGAFLGVRGQAGSVQTDPPIRNASATEDPANRRVHGGGKSRIALHLIPAFRPEIVNTAGGPAVAHSSDFALVSTSKPAAAGEVLSLFATGLGPTRPGVGPGKPFPASPLAVVNSPVEVLVNGKPAEVLAAVGLPGAVDGYQVNFRVPPDTARGTATIQVTAAWIAGSEMKIGVQ
ncbi:MAG: hypothetical protein HY238_16735 [Acidobacteria bacterium]|nr:hypothetical protein [Acidobacteriota bacterium]